MKNNSSYFKNEECEYFPCHKTPGEYFICMYCHCPLYALGDKCGGNFTYIEEYGIKDCSNCVIPHTEGGIEHVQSRLRQVSELAKKNREG